MKKTLRFVGLDVHKDATVIAVAGQSRAGEVCAYGTISSYWHAMERALTKLRADGAGLHFAYCCFQRYSVASLMFASRETACVASPSSIRRRTAMICSGVCFFPLGIWVPFLEPGLPSAMAQFWYVRSL